MYRWCNFPLIRMNSKVCGIFGTCRAGCAALANLKIVSFKNPKPQTFRVYEPLENKRFTVIFASHAKRGRTFQVRRDERGFGLFETYYFPVIAFCHSDERGIRCLSRTKARSCTQVTAGFLLRRNDKGRFGLLKTYYFLSSLGVFSSQQTQNGKYIL